MASATSDAQAARLIGAMIGTLNDYHSDLTTPYGVFGPPHIPYAHHFSPALVITGHLVAPPFATKSGKINYAKFRDGAGYIYIGSFTGDGWGGEIEQALSALGPVPALVVDIRDNGGGDERIGQEVAARLYDRTRVYRITRYRNGPRHSDFEAPTSMSLSPSGTVRFTGPIALVTNRFNGSSAEDFTLMMRVLPQVVTVGDTTLGNGSNPLERELANGWRYRISQSAQSTPDGFVYEGRGLPPSLPVAWSAADTARGRDPYLDAALLELHRRVSYD